MNDFAELGPLMLMVSPIPVVCFAAAALCGFASACMITRTDMAENRLLQNYLGCGVGLWAAVRDLAIPMDVFLIATLPLCTLRSSVMAFTVSGMGLVEWVQKSSGLHPDAPDQAWTTWLPHMALVFFYVASASSAHRAFFRMVLAGLRVWMPRNGVFITAVFVWSGHGGVFARLGSVLLVGLLGKYASMIMAVAGAIDYIRSML